MKENMTKKALQDVAVIYFSPEDEGWIAHSIYTDQIGWGTTPTNALAELIGVVDKLLALAAQDESVAYLQKAPDEIFERMKQSKPFPVEWFEIAHKKARGQWPDAPELNVSEADTEAYAVGFQEAACAAGLPEAV